METSMLNQLAGAAGSAIGNELLKQSLDIAGQQAQTLMESIPKTGSPSLPGIGGNVDEYG